MLSVILVAALAIVFPQTAPNQPMPTATRTAAIGGQVTDRETGAPIPRAVVTARRIGTPNDVRQNFTNQDGRFEFRGLAAGRYEVTAVAGEHRATHARGSFTQQPLTKGVMPTLGLRDGEVRFDIDIALRRTFAISGRVVDEFGEPVSGVGVRARAVNGREGSWRSTDDRGIFRIFGLEPGRYVVCGDVRSFPMISRVALIERFVSTCYPAAPSEADAQTVSVGPADAAGVEIQLRRSRMFAIAGVVVDSTGAPAESPEVGLTRYERNGASSTGTVSRDGTFRFGGLPPGEYAVQASIGSGGDAQERGHLSLQVTDDNLEGLVVVLKKPATVRGRVAFEDGVPPPGDGQPMTITPRSDDAGRTGFLSAPAARVEADHSFTLKGLFGRQRLNVSGLPRGWVVKTVHYKGEDITDIGAEFTTDPRHSVEIVLTSRVAIVSGSVTDDGGRPARGARVVLLPAAPELWTTEWYQFQAAPVLADGRFTLPGVRAGDYLIVAIAGVQWQALAQERANPEFVAKHAERITLVDNDRLTMNLRLAASAERR